MSSQCSREGGSQAAMTAMSGVGDYGWNKIQNRVV